MSSFKEKERLKEQQEKFQAILSGLLKDEDNKYCVDCDAKGPRWASWNLGIFMCIRCAGIHRNLGVHISKVKSVNLDSWTPEQVAMMQEMGNSRGRAVYEANIPDGFRRPQTDSSLEAFIRSKYEQKKYIAREWIPPQPKVPKEWLEDSKSERKKAKAKPAGAVQLPAVPKPSNKPAVNTPPGDAPKASQGAKAEVKIESTANTASNDLLGLEAAAPTPVSGSNELLDLFGGPQTSQAPTNAPAPTAGNSDLMNGTSEGNLFTEEKAEEKKASTKDSILALYGGSGGGTSQPQMYGVPVPQPEMIAASADPSVAPHQQPQQQNGTGDLMRVHDNPFLKASQAFAQSTSVGMSPSNNMYGQTQTAMQPPFNQSGVVPNTFSGMSTAMYSQSSPAHISTSANQMMGNQSGQYPAFSQSSFATGQQKMAPISSTTQAPTLVNQFSPQKLSHSSPTKQRALMELQSFGQSMGQMPGWSSYNQQHPGFYGNQGGMYMPQGQQMYPGMMGQQQGMPPAQQPGMVGQQQGMRAQGMMGTQQGMMGQQPQGMMGQQQAMGMMGQPQGMMGQMPGMMGNPQMGMYNGQMMAGNQAMYNPQQMQFQQMQQQMTALKLNGTQMPQQATPAPTGWGNPGQGHTLSTNLWQ